MIHGRSFDYSWNFSVNFPAIWREHSRATACTPISLFVLTINQANRSVSLLGFDKQAASATAKQLGYGTHLRSLKSASPIHFVSHTMIGHFSNCMIFQTEWLIAADIRKLSLSASIKFIDIGNIRISMLLYEVWLNISPASMALMKSTDYSLRFYASSKYVWR